MIGHISAIFKDKDFWFGPKTFLKLCTETVSVRHIYTVIHR